MFDAVILLIVLGVYARAREPKRTAVLVCVYVSLVGFYSNLFLTDELLPSVLGISQCFGFIYLFMYSRRLGQKDKNFFGAMAYFLLVSALINIDMLSMFQEMGDPKLLDIYTFCAQTVAALHIITMLAYSDVLRDFLEAIWYNIRKLNNDRFGLR